MADKPQTPRQSLEQTLIKPARDGLGGKGTIRDQDTVEFPGATFFQELGSVASLWHHDLGLRRDGFPFLMRAVFLTRYRCKSMVSK